MLLHFWKFNFKDFVRNLQKAPDEGKVHELDPIEEEDNAECV